MRTADEGKRELRRAQGRRLEAAREHADFASRTEAAEALGVSYNTYAQHENGTNGIGRAASAYAAFFSVPLEWLLEGRNPPDWAVQEIEPVEEERRGPAAHHLRPWRHAARLTEAELADKISANVDMVMRWESGDDISATWLRKIAEVLDTTPGLLLDVDPASVPGRALETWLQVVRDQARTSSQVEDLRRAG